MRMEYGCFGEISNLKEIAEVGFASAELDVCEINALSNAAFQSLKKEVRETGIGLHAFSRIMPLSERISSPDFDRQKWFEHFKKGAERTAELGAVMWPLGCGKPRSLPDDETKKAAKQRVDEFLLTTADILKGYHITLVLEPLGPAYSNYIGSLEEAYAFIREYGAGNIKTMCDMRHMVSRGEDFSHIIKFKEYIVHAHIDYPLGTKRKFLKSGDGFDYLPYLKALKAAGYDRLLTIEANCYENLSAEAAESLKYLDRLIHSI